MRAHGAGTGTGKWGGTVGGKPKGYSFYSGTSKMWCFLCDAEHEYHKPTRAEKKARKAQVPEGAQMKTRFRGGRAA